MMGFTLTVSKSGLESLHRRLKALDGTEVEVGFFEEDRYGEENDNLPVAQVAAYNNFGTRFNPQRPFMDETFGNQINQLVIGKTVSEVFKSALKDNRNITALLDRVGVSIKTIMQAEIDNWPGSNSPSTIARKGFNDPLFDTGKMLESVKFIITR